jgi:hypothetical protein
MTPPSPAGTSAVFLNQKKKSNPDTGKTQLLLQRNE